MSAHQDHCGTFVVDPYDIEADCCMHLKEPVRPHQSVTAQLTLVNHEQTAIEGRINWKLAKAETGEIIDDLEDREMGFELESGEQKTYDLDIVPEESSVVHTQINDYDDDFLGTIWYALEDVRSPDEEQVRHGGEPTGRPF